MTYVNRTEKCQRHYHGQFAVDACPACAEIQKRADLAHQNELTLRRGEEKRRKTMEEALIPALADNPQNLEVVCQRVSASLGRVVRPGTIGQMLSRLRREKRTDWAPHG